MHTIRLRGPWQVEAVARFVLQPAGEKVSGTFSMMEKVPDTLDTPSVVRETMPADWSRSLGAGFLGRVRYRRIFQRPTGLESGERVWLVVEPPRSCGVVELNGKRLGEVYHSASPGRFDVTELLEDHNHLDIVVEHPAVDERGVADEDCDLAAAGGLVGEVRLEIED